MKIDLHITRERGCWELQSSKGTTLAVFADPKVALAAACRRGRELGEKGLEARVFLHVPGKVPEVFNYPAE